MHVDEQDLTRIIILYYTLKYTSNIVFIHSIRKFKIQIKQK